MKYLQSIFSLNYINNLVLFLLLLFPFGIRVYNLNYNSPFLDEAMYIVLGNKILEGTWQNENPFIWVGGMPFFYPSLSAIFNNFGGIWLARFFNVILGTASIFITYKIVNKLLIMFKKDKENEIHNNFYGIMAALFLAISPIHIFISRFAVYDMLSFVLFLLGLLYFLYSITSNSVNQYLISGVLFFLSFLAKYTVLMWFPLIFVYAFIIGWKNFKSPHNNVLYFISVLSVLMLTYIGMKFSDLVHFFSDQVTSSNQLMIADITKSFFDPVWPFYLLAVLGLIIFVKNYYLHLLFLLSFLPLFVHLLTNNINTVQQNTLYSLMFILPAISVFFISIIKKYSIYGIITLFLSTIMILNFSFSRTTGLENMWPNSYNAMKYLKNSVSSTDLILAESDDVVVLALYDLVPYQNITGPFSFYYKEENGTSAYGRAISEKYFTYIQLENTSSDIALITARSIGDKYDLIYDKDSFKIYKVNNNE